MRKSLRLSILGAMSFGLAMAVGNEGQANIARAQAFGTRSQDSKLLSLTAAKDFNDYSRKDSKRAQQVAKRLSKRHNPANFEKTPKLDYRKPFTPKQKGPGPTAL